MSNMEDIKQLESLILDRKSFIIGEKEHDEIYLKDIKAINSLINNYTRQKQINEEHKKLNGELREKVKELEEKNKHLSNVSDYETISLECTHLEEQLEIANSKIQELEEENMQKDLETIGTKEYTEASMKEIIEKYYTANEACIPKQKIKDKFEKIQLLYENNLKKIDLKEVEKIDRKMFEGIRLEAQRDFARELLQEIEDK